ncbi:MAG: hypothetical protein AUK35_03545 [Zetaproteobacteria bacterium CG2_30_46_52]|nr:MAG: hypothetical protein AUK35_03545 [Zetaproteobacteria bacterium CG2_30_46_52]
MKKLLMIFTLALSCASVASASDLFYSSSYPADEQASGCEVNHELRYDAASQQMSWVVASVCSGQIAASDAVQFSVNAMRAWTYALHKGVDWASTASAGDFQALHHWQDNLAINVATSTDALGSDAAYIVVSNNQFAGELAKPMLISAQELGVGIAAIEVSRKIEIALRQAPKE